MSYGTPYFATPLNPNRVGRVKPMTKTTQTPEVSKAPKAKYSKTRGEHVKDVLIAMLVTGIVTFIGGMTFQNHQQSAINTAVKAVTPTVNAQASDVKK